MKLPFTDTTDDYQFSQEKARNRADSYVGPDGRKLTWNMSRLCFAQGQRFRLMQLGEHAFADGMLTEYDGILDDMQLVLYLASRTDEEMDTLRLVPAMAIRGAANFFDEAGVQYGDDAFGAWQKVFVEIVSDALFAESEPITEGEQSASPGESGQAPN